MTTPLRLLPLALVSAATTLALAQNPTTAGALQIEPEVSSVGSILTSAENTPTIEDGNATAPVSDADALPAGAAIDATSTRRGNEQDLNVTTPRVPLGQTRPVDYDDIDEEVPLGAEGNSYRPSSPSGFYDGAVEEDARRRGDIVAPQIEPAPLPGQPVRPAAPLGDYNTPGKAERVLTPTPK